MKKKWNQIIETVFDERDNPNINCNMKFFIFFSLMILKK